MDLLSSGFAILDNCKVEGGEGGGGGGKEGKREGVESDVVVKNGEENLNLIFDRADKKQKQAELFPCNKLYGLYYGKRNSANIGMASGIGVIKHTEIEKTPRSVNAAKITTSSNSREP